MQFKKIKTEDEAKDYAIEWQEWQADRPMSWAETCDWHNYFSELGGRFNLTEEFKENGII